MRTRLALLLLFGVLPGCQVAPWREQPQPWTPATASAADDARVWLRDGSELVLAKPRIEDAAAGLVLVGDIDGWPRQVALTAIVRLETRHTELLPVLANVAIGTVVVAALLVAVACSCGHGGGGFSLSGLDFSSPPTAEPTLPQVAPPPVTAPPAATPAPGGAGSGRAPKR